MIKSLTKNKTFQSVISSLIGVAIGLAAGLIALIVIDPAEAFESMGAMLQNFFYFPRENVAIEYFGMTLIRMTPLAMCALSMIYAHKAGLFNIGASGQYAAGACVALLCAIKWRLPWWICLLSGAVSGGLVGALTGVLKAYRNVNEVISGILLNWVILYAVNMVLEPLTNSANLTWMLSVNAPQALLPNLGLDAVFAGNSYVTVALPLTILTVFLVWFILNKTALGYETRAAGFNLRAATLAGVRAKGNIVLTMFIAGCLSGLAAGFIYLCGVEQWSTSVSTVPTMGIDAIAAAFLGCMNPWGSLVSSYFIEHISMGSMHMNRMIYPSEITSMITAIIIYASAFSAIIAKAVFNFVNRKREGGL